MLVCGKPGHIQSECFKLKRDKAKNHASKGKSDKAIVALVKGNRSPKEWALTARHTGFLSFGATAHMTKKKLMITGNTVPADVKVGTAGKETTIEKT